MESECTPYFQDWFSAGDFRARRERIYDAIGAKAIAVVQGAGPVGGLRSFGRRMNYFISVASKSRRYV
jgi:hypothetical protein